MNTKQKAIVLLVCSALGNNFIFNNHAMAMKSLKKIFSSVPSQEKIMKLAKLKLDGISLSKSDEEKLNAYVNNIVDERGYIKIEANNVVNPIIYCLQQFKNIKLFKEILNWIDFHVPAAFTSRKNIDDPYSATPLFFAVNKKFDSYNSKGQIVKLLAPRSDTTAVCKCTKSTDGTTVYITAVDLAYQKSLPKTAAAILSVNSTFNEDVLNGNIEKINEAISAGTDINTPVYAFTGEMFTPLEIALMRRDANMFDYLIQRGGKLLEGHFAGDFVCGVKTKERLQLPDHPDKFETTEFAFLKKVLACKELDFKFKDEKHKSEFINYGVFSYIYLDDELYTLFKARFGEIPEFCLIEACINSDISETQKIEIVTTLINDGATKSLNYATKVAIRETNLQLLKQLHFLGASKNYTTDDLGEAVYAGTSLEIIKYLVEECNVPLDGTYYDDGLCHAFVPHFCYNAQYNPHVIQTAKYLIEKGMLVNSINSEGRTLLKEAKRRFGHDDYEFQKGNKYKRGYSKLGVELYNIFVKAGAKIDLA